MQAQIDIEIRTMPLATRQLKLYCVEFDSVTFSTTQFDHAGIDCPPHIARSVRKRQAEYFCGRLAAHTALIALGTPADAIGSAPNRAPIWPAGVIGSISHNDRLAIAAALADGDLHGLGIDVEPVIAIDMQDSILALVVDRQEQTLLHELEANGGLAFSTALTLAFSAKESFYKAVSAVAGRVLEFNAIKITGIDSDAIGGRVHFRISEAISEAWYPGRCGHVDFIVLAHGDVLTAFAW